MSKQKVIIIDPKDYGLEEKKAGTIESAFLPKKVETDGFVKVYESIINKEINESTCKEARELRLKLVKVRTGIRDIHTAEKAFYLASGKYVDALKNKLTLPVQQMEEKLTEIEKYFENQEKERAKKLREDREKQLEPYGTDTTFIALDLMSDEQFEDLLAKEKLAFETKKRQEEELEQARIERERLDKLETERRLSCAPIIQFMPDNFDFRDSTEKEYKSAVSEATKNRDEHNQEVERQRAELARIKKEQEAKEEKERKEKEKKQKVQTERYNELVPFFQTAGSIDLSSMSEAEFKSFLNQAKKDHADKLAKQAELDRIQKEKAEKEEQERKSKLAPDVDKLRELYSCLKSFEYPEVSSDDAKEAIRKLKSGIENVLRTLAEDAKKLK